MPVSVLLGDRDAAWKSQQAFVVLPPARALVLVHLAQVPDRSARDQRFSG